METARKEEMGKKEWKGRENRKKETRVGSEHSRKPEAQGVVKVFSLP